MSSAPSHVLPQNQPEGMSQLVEVESDNPGIPAASADPSLRGPWLCSQLEAGNILFFARPPFAIPQDDREFLLGQTQTSSALHKNVAYRPAEDRITGLAKSENVEAARLRLILKSYSQHATQFLGELLPPYAGKWKLDFASFRPLEERGRSARLHARNDLPHFDSFPTRPTNGDRILRFFTNLNPTQNRVWTTSQTFEAIGPHFAKSLGLPRPSGANPLARGLRSLAGALRIPGAHRPP